MKRLIRILTVLLLMLMIPLAMNIAQDKEGGMQVRDASGQWYSSTTTSSTTSSVLSTTTSVSTTETTTTVFASTTSPTTMFTTTSTTSFITTAVPTTTTVPTTVRPGGLRGDVNLDGKVDLQDAVHALRTMSGYLTTSTTTTITTTIQP